MTQSIYKAVPGLTRAMGTLDIDKLSTNMTAFEQLFEDLDVRAEFVTNSIDSTTSTTTPIDQVESLITQVAEEHALDVAHMIGQTPQSALQHDEMIRPQGRRVAAVGCIDSQLQNRLDNLRT
eukprot:GHVT01044314.1.p2 GENE.GHVT01044314.1~~GHVT01044314.1.p2  ORF type:complete len:122 (+),score=26.99 GHVT01044314.1:1787-2152(+)